MPTIRKYVNAFQRLSASARYYNTSVSFQIRRFRFLHDRLLFSLDEALFWGLTDPRLSTDLLENYISLEAVTRLREKVNAQAGAPDVNNKLRFYSICTSAQLPIPEIYGLILREKIGNLTALKGVRFPCVEPSALPAGAIVAKPVWGGQGRGLCFLERREDGFLLEGRLLNANALRRELVDRTPNDDYICQKRLCPHPDLSQINKTESVQSVRVNTFLDGSGHVHILFARLKIVCGNNDIDNFSLGTKGNALADVDLVSGRLSKVVIKNVSEPGLRTITRHPDTGQELLPFTLPDWDAVTEVVSEGARLFPKTPTLGWDVALAPDGPVILEANDQWATFAIAPYRKPPPVARWNALIG